jgi:hypothetical protein
MVVATCKHIGRPYLNVFWKFPAENNRIKHIKGKEANAPV